MVDGEVVVMDERRSREKIMKECFVTEVGAMALPVLEAWLAQTRQLLRRMPRAQWQCEVLEAEYSARTGGPTRQAG